MRFPRRQFLCLAAGVAALPVASRMAQAQAYPTKPVRWMTNTAAGGAADIVARQMGQWLSERLGQPFVIENRPGAGGSIAIGAVVKAPADGYTLLMASNANASNAALYETLHFNFLRDIAPVASITRAPLALLVNASIPANTVPEFIAYAKANPGKVSMASAGNGTAPHLAGELFKMMTGVDMVHVPYRGGAPALIDLLGGQVQVMFSSLPAIDYIRAGKLRALGVTTAMHWTALPDVPPIADFVPGYEASTWFGVGAPKNTPAEIVNKLNKEVNAALADPKMEAQLAESGGFVRALSPADFGKFLAEETEKWGKVVKFAGIKAD